MNKNETIADIRKEAEARFRELLEKHVDSLGHIQAMQQFNQVFDRIEAARSCEVQSLQGTIVKLNDAIAEKQELNENSKRAQFEFCKFQRLLKAVRCLCDEVFNYMKVCNPSVAGGCELRRALENVKDALALFSNSLKNENSDAVNVTAGKQELNANSKSAQIEFGNVAKLREALGKLRAELWNNTVIAGKKKFALYEIADAALAAPPRNCDVGTAEEQYERHKKLCSRACLSCPVHKEFDFRKALRWSCQLVWAQLPYEESGVRQ